MKEKLLKVLENPNNQLIAVDLDGTLCEGEFWGEGDPRPLVERINYINELYKKGAHIIIYTARDPQYFEQTNSWLITHGVRFHGISMMRKPGADLYIDDKTLNVEDVFVDHLTLEEITLKSDNPPYRSFVGLGA